VHLHNGSSSETCPRTTSATWLLAFLLPGSPARAGEGRSFSFRPKGHSVPLAPVSDTLFRRFDPEDGATSEPERTATVTDCVANKRARWCAELGPLRVRLRVYLHQRHLLRVYPDETTAHDNVAKLIGGFSCNCGEHLAAVAVYALNRAVALTDPQRPLTRCQREWPRAKFNCRDDLSSTFRNSGCEA
jgi:hypothetical protein